jgi:GT2 family glycosyltransferase
MRSTQDWCSFLISELAFKQVGRFDENFFPAYFEDNDYEYRLKLEAIPVQTDYQLNPYMYRNNSTSEKDPAVKNFIETNKKYYVNKWGGMPKKEIYTKPFNPK